MSVLRPQSRDERFILSCVWAKSHRRAGRRVRSYTAATTIVSGAVEIFALLLTRSAFSSLASVDRPHFRAPSILTLLIIVGTPIASTGALLIFTALPSILSSVSQAQATGAATPPTIPSTVLQTLTFGAGVAGLGGLIAFIGLIGGVMLGLWRVGGRYDNSLIKAGAILIIIPFLDIVVPVLLLIGVHQARGKISGPPAIP